MPNWVVIPVLVAILVVLLVVDKVHKKKDSGEK